MLSIEAFRRVMAPALQVELPMASVTASNPDPAVGEECRKANLDMAVGEGARSMDLKRAKISSEVMAATWKVHHLQNILIMTSWVSDYSKNPVTQ
jgi:hypothetical protein